MTWTAGVEAWREYCVRLFDDGAAAHYPGTEAEVITAVQHHDEHRMADDDKRGPGRPPLAEDEETVKITVKVPISLREEAHAKIGRGVTTIMRGLLEGYLRLPEETRRSLDTEAKVIDFMKSFGDHSKDTKTTH